MSINTILNRVFAGFIDAAGNKNYLKWNADAPQVCAQPYLQALAEGDISGHTPWSKIGFTPTVVAATDSDIWSAAGVYTFPVSAAQWDVLSANAADGATSIKAATCDAGGTATTLNDADVDFLAATAVEVGDCLIIDKSGTTPEWGYVTGVATHTLTFANGLSSGGTCATARAYAVLNYNAAGKTGAQAVKIEYLDSAYSQKSEIVILSSSAAVNTVNTDLFRVNSFLVIATGSGAKPAGALSLRLAGGASIYSYITAGFTRARNSVYTVPAGKTLYIVEFRPGFGVTGKANNEYGRLILRANAEPSTMFYTGNIFYVFAEIISFSSTIPINFEMPIKFPAKTDIKSSIISTEAGAAAVVLRGWLE